MTRSAGRRGPVTTCPSRSTRTACCRSCTRTCQRSSPVGPERESGDPRDRGAAAGAVGDTGTGTEADAEGVDQAKAIEMRLLLEAIHARYGYDLREYTTASLGRRVQAVL